MVQLSNRLLLVALSICGVVTDAQNNLSFDEIIAADSDLTLLESAVMSANVSLTDLFATAATIFAPTDAAFLLRSKTSLRNTLTNNILLIYKTFC